MSNISETMRDMFTSTGASDAKWQGCKLPIQGVS